MITMPRPAKHLHAVLTVFALCAPAAAFGVLTLVPQPVEAAVDSDALSTFKAHHESVVKLVKRGAGAKKLQAKVDELLDYDWLAKTALGGEKKYAGACGPKCGEFEALLGQLIRENYLRMVRKAASHEVAYLGEKTGRSGAVKIDTEITLDKNGRKQKLKVSYVMHQSGGKWQVRDIITDGISLAKTYRHEFKQVLKGEGIVGILTRLQAKIDELATKP
jgi:phospholipid transport system substrate-binding protein